MVLQDRPVMPRAEEAGRMASVLIAAIPASPLVAIPSQASRGRPRRSSCASTASAVRGALVIRMTLRPCSRHCAQPLGRAGVKIHAVVDDAPDVAQDHRIFGIQRVPESSFEAGLAPAPASIGATSSGLLSSRKVNGGVSTSTTSTGMPAARKRNCSRPSSVSSSLTGVAT